MAVLRTIRPVPGVEDMRDRLATVVPVRFSGTGSVGFGVQATRDIPAWTFLCQYPGHVYVSRGRASAYAFDMPCHNARGDLDGDLVVDPSNGGAGAAARVLDEFKGYLGPYLNEPAPGQASNVLVAFNWLKQVIEFWTFRPVAKGDALTVCYGTRFARGYDTQCSRGAAGCAELPADVREACRAAQDPRAVWWIWKPGQPRPEKFRNTIDSYNEVLDAIRASGVEYPRGGPCAAVRSKNRGGRPPKRKASPPPRPAGPKRTRAATANAASAHAASSNAASAHAASAHAASSNAASSNAASSNAASSNAASSLLLLAVADRRAAANAAAAAKAKADGILEARAFMRRLKTHARSDADTKLAMERTVHSAGLATVRGDRQAMDRLERRVSLMPPSQRAEIIRYTRKVNLASEYFPGDVRRLFTPPLTDVQLGAYRNGVHDIRDAAFLGSGRLPADIRHPSAHEHIFVAGGSPASVAAYERFARRPRKRYPSRFIRSAAPGH